MIRVSGNKNARTDLRLLARRHRIGSSANRRFTGRIIGMIAVLLVCGGSAFGQFIVQPMRLELQCAPGRRHWPEFVLENQSGDTSRAVDMRIAEVTQRPDGVWANFGPETETRVGPNGEKLINLGTQEEPLWLDISKVRSCASWVRLPVQNVQLDPWARQPVRLQVEVPSGTRGYYCAALLATTLVSAGDLEGVETDVMLEFLVPIIIEVQGRPERHQINCLDATLEYHSQTPYRPAATMVRMDVENDGGTYSRLNGYARVWGEWGGHWRKLTDVEFREMGIIPGVKLELREDIGRALPSGKYKVDGYVFVDGHKGDAISQEFEFEGDPRVMEVPVDAALDLDPRELYIETVPGATRAGSVTVVNGSEEAVDVEVSAELPQHLVATVLGNVRGEEYGCTDWLEVSPKTFRLPGFARKNLRIISKMPEAATSHPDYYSMIKFKASYPDGTNAGTTHARVVVQNKRGTGNPRVEGLRLALAEAAPERYLVTAVFGNFGNTHVMPDCRAVVTAVTGDVLRKQIDMRSEAWSQTGIMLPLEKRNFTGVLDVKDLPSGKYRVTALLTHGQGMTVQRQAIVQVSLAGGRKELRVDTSGEVPLTTIEL